MEAEDQTKKPYSYPTKKLTPEQTKKLIADRNNCSEEEAADSLNTLRQRNQNNAQQERCPVNEGGEVREKRRYQRLELNVDVIVRTDSALLPGRTQDISECGMSAILPVELREGQEVELQIRLPSGTQTIRAIVRHRNVFRHGFEFVQPLHLAD
jgi:hypothetical protein